MSNRYLVTGACGHLGNTIVRLLHEKGKNVRALLLPDDKYEGILPDGTEICRGDVRDRHSLVPFFKRDDGSERLIVIHCAGIVSIASKFSEVMFDTNVNGTRNVIDMSIKNDAYKIVHVSSVHAIPEKPKGQVITETDKFDPELVKGQYAKSKALATEYVLEKAAQGANICVVHPSGICGPYDYGRGHLTQMLIDYCRGTLTAGVSGGGYDFVDVRDVAAGIIACADSDASTGCYILSGRFMTVCDVLDEFHDVTGKKKINTFLPIWFAKATAPIAEKYYQILKQPPLYTPYSLFTLTSNAIFSSDRAERELGYSSRDFAGTVRDTYLWLKAAGRIC